MEIIFYGRIIVASFSAGPLWIMKKEEIKQKNKR